MRIVVTGGAGFIGSHLVEMLLNDGHSVAVIDNLSTGRLQNLSHLDGEYEFINADIAVPGPWMERVKKSEWTFHLAALADIVPSIKNPIGYYNANVSGTLNVIEAARAGASVRMVYAASSSCYGIAKVTPTPETAPISPMYPYALTKYLGEELVLHWAKLYRLPFVSLRFFNVYGTRSRTSGTYGAMFGVFLAQKLANKPFTVVGTGEQSRDFTYVTDVCRALVTAAKSYRAAGEVYNVGSGATVSVNKIIQLLGGDTVQIPKRPGEPDITFADITKIRRELSWTPQIAIEEGVKKLLGDIEYWREAPVWQPDSIAEQTKEWFQFLGN